MSLARLSVLFLVAALTAPLSATQVAAQTERLIPLEDGRTCWTETSMRCFRYSERSRRAHRAGFRPIVIPQSWEAQPGFITESTFIHIEREINKQTGGNR